MASTRTYGDRCGIARALDAVGNRWALLVVRELLLQPKRFTDLQKDLPGISPDMLSARLKELEAAGITSAQTLAPPASSRVYSLTNRGRELEPVLLALGDWGRHEPISDPEAQLSPDTLMIALKTTFDPRPNDVKQDLHVNLEVEQRPYSVSVVDKKLTITAGNRQNAQATLSADRNSLAELVWRRIKLADAVSDGTAELSGDRRAVNRFLRLFS